MRKSNGGVKEKEKPKTQKKDQKKSTEEPPTGYIHVRARRGQATDSHSLAERVQYTFNRLKIIYGVPYYVKIPTLLHEFTVMPPRVIFMSHYSECCKNMGFFQVRREKISEKMKMLQRLVPGCDKVKPFLCLELFLSWLSLRHLF